MPEVIKLLMERFGLNQQQATDYAKSMQTRDQTPDKQAYDAEKQAILYGMARGGLNNAGRGSAAMGPQSGPGHGGVVASEDMREYASRAAQQGKEIEMPATDVSKGGPEAAMMKAAALGVNIPPVVNAPPAFAQGAYKGYTQQADLQNVVNDIKDPKAHENNLRAMATYLGYNR